MWLDRSFCTYFSYWCKSEVMPSSLLPQTFSIPFSLDQNSLANAQKTVIADTGFFLFSLFFFPIFLPFFSFCFVFTQRQSKIQTSSLLPGDTGEERWLQPHFQARASLEALSERCRPAVHTCKVLQLGEVHMLMWVPPCGTVPQLRLAKEKPLVTLQ